MLGEEAEELQHVAPVGFDRLRRHAAFVAEMAEPAFDLGRDFGGDKVDIGLRARQVPVSKLLRPVRSGGGRRGDRPPHLASPAPFTLPKAAENRPKNPSMARRVVDVLVPVALDRAYSYRVPDALALAPGDIVSVPLGAREATAVVWAENPKPNPRLDNRLKDVEEKLDLPPLKPELRSFVDWVANYTRGLARHGFAHVPAHGRAPRRRARARRRASRRRGAATHDGGARQRVLSLLADGMVRAKGEAAREAGVSAGVIDGLIDEGTLQTVVLPPEPVAEKPDPDFAPPDFTHDQAAAAAALKATVAQGGYAVTLIDGVTGSGKTEVYFEAVADMIRRGRQSLILMPEIALTAQFLDRFAARFGVRPAEWHSELSPRKRARTWRAVADGDVSVVVGARSALFLPYADLGLDCRR